MALREILSALGAIDHQNCYVIFTYANNETVLPPLHQSFRHEVVPLGAPPTRLRQLRFLTDKLSLPYQAWRHRLDVLHVSVPFELLYGWDVWPFTPPVVVTAWDIIPWLYPRAHFGRQSALLSRLYAHHVRLLRKASHVQCISQTTLDDLVRYFSIDPRHMSVNVLGIDESVWNSAPPRPLPRGVTPPYLLHVGGDSPNKNIPLYIDACDLLRQRGHTFQLVLAGPYGTSALVPHIQRYRARHGEESLVVTGFLPRSDLLALYRGAHAFAFPSTYEGFGLPPLEAMACGVPTVISWAPSLVELYGEAALICDSFDAAALADRLASVLGDERLRCACREKGLAVASRFSWPQTAARALEMYERAAMR